MLSHLQELELCGLNNGLGQVVIQFKKSPHKSNSFMCEGISKFGKFTKILNKDKQVKKLLFLGILLTLLV